MLSFPVDKPSCGTKKRRVQPCVENESKTAGCQAGTPTVE